ncbi:hypothetical protein BC962_1075 [Gillisia mitskevichiae]|uniref:Uncharacterized protein n=1 Tax=Gillisia mitskevichiae TaxID=270921 RepID=A0A495PZX1_9FLAO|nr:hypothetical protein [Gillisia mitskevichiae]RKS56096.1 hypothetical protein BC962_1075 [Gillisia mitskevichiae]
MKRVIYLTALILTGATSLISCRDTAEKETVVVKEVRVETEKAEPVEERKGILERTAQEVDKEVNKEVDKRIDEIGDDN